jgi:hypothetical protein
MQNKKAYELVSTVTPERPGIPRTMGYGLSSCSPRRSGFFDTVADEQKIRQLDAGLEASGPHDFAVRFYAVRQGRIHVHRIPFRVS